MIEVYNRVKETSTTSGSGVIALNGATSGFQSFASVLSSGDKTYYTIVNKQNWEVGIGTYLSNSLQRSTILSSSNGGMPLNLSGSSNVFICYPSEKSVFKDENDRVVIGNSGIIFSDNSIQLTSFDVEKAQDAVGGILTNSSTINFSYNDNTPSISAVIPTGAITNDLIATGIDVSKLSGIINSSNLPSYVDDVLEYASFASLPPTGESGKIYLTIDTNRSYRWSGSQYVQITDTTALWGSITGTLSDQTDLINYVVPQTRSVIAGTGLTGGGQLSSNVTLNLGNTAVTPGSYGSSSGVSSFTVDAQGRLTQASEVSINGLLPTGGSEGQILAKNSATNYDTGWIDNYAKELVQTIKNSTHTTLTKGQVVYISGADGTNPTISLAVASGEATSSKTLGFLKQDLNHGDIGYVVTEGFLDGINTNAATTEGDPVWLSPTIPGGVVYGLANKPYAPNHMVFLGFVVRKNINNGRIYVKVQNGFELKELHDVLAQSPSDGDIIRYVSSSGLWVSQPMPISYTDENAQDAVGNILTNTSSVNFSYNDNLNTISAVVVDSGVNHNLLSNYVANEHVNHTGVLINAGTGLTGGGDISSSRTISIANTTVSSGNYGSSNQVGTFTVNPQGQLTAAANVSITPASIGAVPTSRSLTINGTSYDLTANRSWTVGDVRTDSSYADPNWITSLSVTKLSGVISSTNLPSYVDDVLEYANTTAFPATGEAGKIYVALDTNRTYRWGGSVYVEITDTTAVWGGISGTLSNQTDLTSFLSSTYTPQVRTLSAGTGLSGGGDFSANRTISLANTAVVAGSYGSNNQVASFTVDAQGRLTAASNVSITPSSIGALGSLNGLTGSTQTFGTGTTGTDFGIVSAAGVHTFNLPDASSTARGLVTTGSQSFSGNKTFVITYHYEIRGNQSRSGILQSQGFVTGAIHGGYKWTGGNNIDSAVDLVLERDAAGVLAQRNSTNTQAFRVYNTYTSGTDYERLGLQFATYSSARYAQLACESAGIGIANMNLVLTPKGTGALIAGPMPDGTATGGNARGQYAIDLQTYRTAATQVTADYGVSIGTQITNIGGVGSVGIGRNCAISNGQLGGEVAIGRNCSVTSYRGIAIGASASAGSDAISMGVASNAADQGSICFNGAASSWTGVNIWRNNYSGQPTGTAYSQRTLTGALAVGLAHIRTSNTTQTTIETIGYTTFISTRFRHKGAIFHTSLSVFAVRSDGAIAKFQRNVVVKDISNAAGTSSTLSIIQVETVGTDYSEISGASISFAVDSTAKSVAVRCVGEAEYAATGVASTDIITAVGHPFANDDIIIFNTLTGGSGLTANPAGQYYLGIYKVINVSGNTFQLATPGSSTTPIDFTTDITAATIARPICWSTSGPMTTVLAGGY